MAPGSQRTHVPEEPGASIAHARIREGPGQLAWMGLSLVYSTGDEISVDKFATRCTVAARRSRAGEWGPVETCSRWGEGRRALVNGYISFSIPALYSP
jgi:hypothetical protein